MKWKTVGVRFARDLDAGVYTYKVPASFKAHLGQQLVVEARRCNRGAAVVYVVVLEPEVPEGYTLETLTPIKYAAVEIKA